MYVCICKAVNDQTIREAVDQGACRMRDLKTSLGVVGQCGACACEVKLVLDQAKLQKI